MKKNVATILLAVSMYAGIALAGSNNPLLLGTWKSDKALTTAYNKQIDKVSKNMVGVVDNKTGHMVITFAPDRLRSTGAGQDIQIDGMAEHRGAHDFDSQYSIVSGDQHSISVSTRDETSGLSSDMVFNFDDHDTMWVRAGGDDMTVADPRLRVYFKRVP
jgi:hypothetical protein